MALGDITNVKPSLPEDKGAPATPTRRLSGEGLSENSGTQATPTQTGSPARFEQSTRQMVRRYHSRTLSLDNLIEAFLKRLTDDDPKRVNGPFFDNISRLQRPNHKKIIANGKLRVSVQKGLSEVTDPNFYHGAHVIPLSMIKNIFQIIKIIDQYDHEASDADNFASSFKAAFEEEIKKVDWWNNVEGFSRLDLVEEKINNIVLNLFHFIKDATELNGYDAKEDTDIKQSYAKLNYRIRSKEDYCKNIVPKFDFKNLIISLFWLFKTPPALVDLKKNTYKLNVQQYFCKNQSDVVRNLFKEMFNGRQDPIYTAAQAFAKCYVSIKPTDNERGDRLYAQVFANFSNPDEMREEKIMRLKHYDGNYTVSPAPGENGGSQRSLDEEFIKVEDKGYQRALYKEFLRKAWKERRPSFYS